MSRRNRKRQQRDGHRATQDKDELRAAIRRANEQPPKTLTAERTNSHD